MGKHIGTLGADLQKFINGDNLYFGLHTDGDYCYISFLQILSSTCMDRPPISRFGPLTPLHRTLGIRDAVETPGFSAPLSPSEHIVVSQGQTPEETAACAAWHAAQGRNKRARLERSVLPAPHPPSPAAHAPATILEEISSAWPEYELTPQQITTVVATPIANPETGKFLDHCEHLLTKLERSDYCEAGPSNRPEVVELLERLFDVCKKKLPLGLDNHVTKEEHPELFPEYLKASMMSAVGLRHLNKNKLFPQAQLAIERYVCMRLGTQCPSETTEPHQFTYYKQKMLLIKLFGKDLPEFEKVVQAMYRYSGLRKKTRDNHTNELIRMIEHPIAQAPVTQSGTPWQRFIEYFWHPISGWNTNKTSHQLVEVMVAQPYRSGYGFAACKTHDGKPVEVPQETRSIRRKKLYGILKSIEQALRVLPVSEQHLNALIFGPNIADLESIREDFKGHRPHSEAVLTATLRQFILASLDIFKHSDSPPPLSEPGQAWQFFRASLWHPNGMPKDEAINTLACHVYDQYQASHGGEGTISDQVFIDNCMDISNICTQHWKNNLPINDTF
jgi:hypothetical protein